MKLFETLPLSRQILSLKITNLSDLDFYTVRFIVYMHILSYNWLNKSDCRQRYPWIWHTTAFAAAELWQRGLGQSQEHTAHVELHTST